MPAEAAYRFSGDTPTHWAGRGVVTAWIIGLQFVFALLSLIIVYTTALAGRRLQLDESSLNRSLFIVMGNILALPQIILFFASLDIFLYNAHQVKLLPLWVWAVIVMALGVVVLGMYFLRTLRKLRRLQGKN